MIAFCADVHVGNHKRHGGQAMAGINRRCRLVLNALGQALALARDRGARGFVVCGDLFDSSNVEPQVLACALDLFREHVEETKMRVVILRGNHDMRSADAGDHALGVLDDYAMIIEEPTRLEYCGVDLWAVPYMVADTLPQTWLPKACAEMAKAPRPAHLKAGVLAVHLGIKDADTPPWLRNAHDAIDAQVISAIGAKHGLDAVFAGNWHDGALWAETPPVHQCGALAPTGWDNPGLAGYGGVTLFDPNTVATVQYQVKGPRFLKLRHGDAVPPADGNLLFVQVVASAGEDVTAAVGALDAAVEAGRVAGGEVLVDRAEATAMAATAAYVTRSAATLEEAISQYLAMVPLDEGVPRAEVTKRTREYMKVPS